MKSVSLPKVLSLCSALLLAGGYVWMRQRDAVNDAKESGARKHAALPGSKSPELSGEGAPPSGLPEDGRTNADFIGERTILPGSKSFLVLPPALEDEPEDRTVLPGSKSIDRILQPPSPDKEEP